MQQHKKGHHSDVGHVGREEQDSPKIQQLIEQLDHDLQETQRSLANTQKYQQAHTSTLDLEDIRSRLRD